MRTVYPSASRIRTAWSAGLPAIGTAVAVKMRQIAKNHQVLCITHLPQIAAYANQQYLVYKEETGEHTRSNAIRL